MTQDENVHFERYDITESLARKVGRTQVAEGASQQWRRKEKKLMKKVYQRIEWATGDISWVAREVVRIELRNSGMSDEGEVERECDKIMKDACFSLETYKVGAGQWLTKAEVCRQMLQHGCTKQECRHHLRQGQLKWQSGDLRDAPDEELDIIKQKLQQALKGPFMQQRKCRVREAKDANPQDAEDVIMQS